MKKYAGAFLLSPKPGLKGTVRAIRRRKETKQRRLPGKWTGTPVLNGSKFVKYFNSTFWNRTTGTLNSVALRDERTLLICLQDAGTHL